MKTTLFTLLLLCCATLAAFAQHYENRPKISAGFDLGISTGPVSDEFPAAGNFRFKLESPVNDSPVSLVFTTGYTFYVSKDANANGFYYDDNYHSIAGFLPLEAGVRIYANKGFYLEGNVGASFDVSGIHEYYTNKSTAFIYSPVIGYVIPVGRSGRYGIDVRLGYENRSEPGGGYAQVFGGAAFSFGL